MTESSVVFCPRFSIIKSFMNGMFVGLDEEFKNVYPSVLATWAPIDYALKNNLKVFDFMGVGVPDTGLWGKRI